ncbi:hypothetical protein LTR36_006849 [Oleoguttula mirabilis]|uniref:chitinase n=1 Tax=Oleoguttula mirabilis TaxID=1507867 RepID=A0AAV9JB58_9PEZI|nr:hypothetical protein LTR36_006849 [Oleoguttula mirabilis]
MSCLILLPVALLVASVAAQTSTDCNPLNATCPIDAALGTTYNSTFSASTTELNTDLWNVTAGGEAIQFSDNGAALVISASGDSVTAQSTFYMNFGTVEIIMQAAAGQGIISTFNLLSDDLDEIDLEIMGGNESYVESNWYGHGNTSQFNAKYHACDGPQLKTHNYTINWTKEQLEWIIDGTVARTVPYAASGLYPQTPSMLKFGIWAGGDSSEPNGTIEWAGGLTDWSKGPFTMIVQSIKITDASTNTTSYAYGDQTGDYSSITSVSGESEAYKQLNKQSTVESVAKKWSSLSTGAKIGIASAVGGTLLIAFIGLTTFCIIQRRRGKRERAAADQQWDENTAELMAYRNRMAKGEFAVSSMGHGEKF